MPPGVQSTGVANWFRQEAWLVRGSQAGDKLTDPPANMVLAFPLATEAPLEDSVMSAQSQGLGTGYHLGS